MATIKPSSKAAAPAASQPTIERAADFIGGLGVNTHLGNKGQTAANIIADMAYLGLDNIRQQAIGPKTPASAVAAYGQMAAAGLKFDWLTGADLGATLSDLKSFLKARPGSVAAVEGPNEVNNFAFSYNGHTGTTAAVAYQASLYAAVKGDPLTRSIPVLNFTDSPRTAGAADAANAHPYPKQGKQPLDALTTALTAYQRLMPGKPIYFTEAGYFSLPGKFGWEGVDETTQAKLDLNLIMDAEKLGSQGTYLYDLIDDGADPSGTIGADHFGLFTLSGQAKPAATAIHNLTSILADGGAGAASFTPTPLDYSISGLPANGSSLALEKSDGTYDIIVWAEPQIWDPSSHKEVAAPGQSVTVELGSSFAQVSVFDPLASASAIQTSVNASAATINLSDHPLIVQVSNFAQAMAGAAAGDGALGGAVPAAATAQVAPVLLSGHA